MYINRIQQSKKILEIPSIYCEAVRSVLPKIKSRFGPTSPATAGRWCSMRTAFPAGRLDFRTLGPELDSKSRPLAPAALARSPGRAEMGWRVCDLVWRQPPSRFRSEAAVFILLSIRDQRSRSSCPSHKAPRGAAGPPGEAVPCMGKGLPMP